MSLDWTGLQATSAQKRGDSGQAIYWYRRYLGMGADESWAWSNLAEIYGFRGDKAQYVNALRELRKIDNNAANEIEDDYGKPSG